MKAGKEVTDLCEPDTVLAVTELDRGFRIQKAERTGFRDETHNSWGWQKPLGLSFPAGSAEWMGGLGRTGNQEAGRPLHSKKKSQAAGLLPDGGPRRPLTELPEVPTFQRQGKTCPLPTVHSLPLCQPDSQERGGTPCPALKRSPGHERNSVNKQSLYKAGPWGGRRFKLQAGSQRPPSRTLQGKGRGPSGG